MSKILVQVYVPAAGRRSEILIPYECDLGKTTSLVRALFRYQADSRFIPTDDTALCDYKSGRMLDVTKSAEEVGLENGSRLMLV